MILSMSARCLIAPLHVASTVLERRCAVQFSPRGRLFMSSFALVVRVVRTTNTISSHMGLVREFNHSWFNMLLSLRMPQQKVPHE